MIVLLALSNEIAHLNQDITMDPNFTYIILQIFYG